MSIVRTLYAAAQLPGRPGPHGALQVNLLYPAAVTGSDRERDFGIVDAAEEGAPFPVVLFLNGVNCDPARYEWLLLDLVRRGVVAVTVRWVDETMPGVVAMTPGMDLQYCRPDTYGQGPTASAIGPVMEVLQQLQSGDGPLAGKLDLTRLVLGGHSGGAAVALQSADPRYFDNIRAVFSYAGHTAASTALGFEPNTVLPLCSELPVLLLGGSEDGVIVTSSNRYGVQAEPDTMIRRTFDESLGGERGDRYLAIVRGANHFTVVHPADPTAGRAFLDRPASEDEPSLRGLIASCVGLFIDAHVLGKADAQDSLIRLLEGPLLARFQRK